MELTKEEQERIIEHFRRNPSNKNLVKERQKIIEMSRKGASVQEIKSKVTKNVNLITETRMWARRRGLL